MRDHSGGTGADQRPDIRTILEEFAANGRNWGAAELRLARLEAHDLKTRTVQAAIAAGVSFAAAFCILTALTQAGIFFLAPLFASAGWAALATAAMLCIVVVVSVMVIRRAMRWEAESLLFRWCAARPERISR